MQSIFEEHIKKRSRNYGWRKKWPDKRRPPGPHAVQNVKEAV